MLIYLLLIDKLTDLFENPNNPFLYYIISPYLLKMKNDILITLDLKSHIPSFYFTYLSFFFFQLSDSFHIDLNLHLFFYVFVIDLL